MEPKRIPPGWIAAACAVLALTACDEPTGPAGKVGRGIDEAVRAAGEKLEQAGAAIGRRAKHAGEAVEGAAQKTGEAVGNAVEETGRAIEKTGEKIQDAARDARKP